MLSFFLSQYVLFPNCDFGFNDNSIRNQKIFWPIAGDICGQDIVMVVFTNETLPSRKKPKKIESDHIIVLEFLLSLTLHQIKTPISSFLKDKKATLQAFFIKNTIIKQQQAEI